MNQGMGVILLDGLEVVARIYVSAGKNKWKLLDYQRKEVSSFSRNSILDTSDFIETISQIFLSKTGRHIEEWRILSRHLPEFVIKDVRLATNFEVVVLTRILEQELICLGVLK